MKDYHPDIKVVQQAFGFVKETFYETIRESNAEGVVIANITGTYIPGKRNNNIGKYKFTNDIDCVVVEVGIDGKDNMSLGLYNEDNTLVEVGKNIYPYW